MGKGMGAGVKWAGRRREGFQHRFEHRVKGPRALIRSGKNECMERCGNPQGDDDGGDA